MTNKRKKYLSYFIISLFIMAGCIYYARITRTDYPEVDYTPQEIEEPVDISLVRAEIIEYPAAESATVEIPDFGFSGVAEKEKDLFDFVNDSDAWSNSRPITLSTAEPAVEYETPLAESEAGKAYLREAALNQPPQDTDDYSTSKIAMVTAPVAYKIIKSAAEYNNFKKTAKGDYPAVNFTKNSLVVLESETNLPHNIFEIYKLEKVEGKDVLEYRVNILGLSQKANSHTYLAIPKSVKEVELKQVM